MATINYAAREINVKIVYYGPALSGKTTNLQIIHKKVPQEAKSDMVSLATEADRTLFFDFLPIDLGKIKGFTTKIQLYTVPGQVYYNATRKLVLRGVDGIVFVADSSADKLKENIESLDNMEENLAEYGYSLKSIPVVLQWNKRDCENPMSVEELDEKLNRYNSKCVSAIAMSGKGVFDTLKVISKEVIDVLNKKYEGANGTAKPAASAVVETPKPIGKPTAAAQTAQNDEFTDVFATPKETAKPQIEKIQEEVKPISKPVQPAATQSPFMDDFFDNTSVTPAAEVKPAVKQTPAQYKEIELDEITDVNIEKRIAEREKKAEKIINGLSAEMNLDDMFDMPVTPKTQEVKPEPVVSNSVTSNFDDDFGGVQAKTETITPRKSEPETTILEDVLDDSPTDISAVKPVEQNAIKAAFENKDKYSDGWVPPETLLFSSVDTNSSKNERIIAAKRKPINPKYKKSFMDNLFKKPE